jgi:hypothetical protein
VFFYWFDLPKASQKVPGLGSFATWYSNSYKQLSWVFSFSCSTNFKVFKLLYFVPSTIAFLHGEISKIFFEFLSVGKKTIVLETCC